MRFNKKENKTRMLKLLDGCVDSPDDNQYFGSYLDKTYEEGKNTININYRGVLLRSVNDDDLYNGWADDYDVIKRIIKSKNIDIEVLKDLFFDKILTDTSWSDESIRNLLFNDSYSESFHYLMYNTWRKNQQNAIDNLFRTFNIKDVPLAYSSWLDNDHKVLYVYDENNKLRSDMIIHRHQIKTQKDGVVKQERRLVKSSPNKPIFTIRKLKALSEKYGEISRKSMEMNGRWSIGKKTEKNGKKPNRIFTEQIFKNSKSLDPNQFSGYIFTKKELLKLHDKANEKFLETVKHDNSILYEVFHSEEPVEKFGSVMLAQQLALE
jgi:hypothetical protein